MKIETDTKLIVCMLPQGKGVGLIERLSKEKGIQSANVSTGRGRGAGAGAMVYNRPHAVAARLGR